MKRVRPEIREKISANIKSLIGPDSDVVRFAETIGVSRDIVNNWIFMRSDIRLNDLVTISEKYGVSVDYLLGISEYPSPNIDVQGASQLTGLSNKSINTLSMVKQIFSDHPAYVLNKLIEDIVVNTSDSPKDVLSQIYSLFIFDHLNHPYKIVNGDCEVDQTPEIVRDAEIKLTDEMMLDVILDGIQRSLLRIRENLKAGDIDGQHQ